MTAVDTLGMGWILRLSGCEAGCDYGRQAVVLGLTRGAGVTLAGL